MNALFGISLIYTAIGLMTAVLFVRDKTGKDSWPNLWANRKMALRAFITWPKIFLTNWK